MDIASAFLALFATITPTPPYLGGCIEDGIRDAVHCSYAPRYEIFLDEIVSDTGKRMMAGPWANDDDINDVIVFALTKDISVIANVTLRGVGIVSAKEKTIAHDVTIDMSKPKAAFEMYGNMIYGNTLRTKP